VPQLLQLLDGLARCGAHHELARHALDVLAGHAGLDARSERHGIGQTDTSPEQPGCLAALEVLVEMTGHVARTRRCGEHVDEAEQLGLERRA
jgi:hypothetical protein